MAGAIARMACEQEPRDQDKAIDQVCRMVRRHLTTAAPVGLAPIDEQILTDNHILNLARHIVMCIEVLGR